MKKKYRVIADTSAHNLPVGAIVEQVAPPHYAIGYNIKFYSQGGEDDLVAIEDNDLEEV